MFWNNKNKINKLLDLIDNQSNEILKLKEQNDRIERILKYSKPDEVAWRLRTKTSYDFDEDVRYIGTRYDVYLYVHGTEYIFEGLHLHNPSFTIGENANIIYVIDLYDFEKHCNSYVLDTNTRTYIQTKKE